MPKKAGQKSFATNKKAFAFLEILEKIEAGIQLTGGEVKAVRNGSVNLKGSFIDIHNGVVWMNNAHISRYKYDNTGAEPLRKRRLLMHKEQIEKLEMELKKKGITAVPLEFYDKNGLIKVLIGICRGKKMHDRREDLKKRAQEIDVKRALKRY